MSVYLVISFNCITKLFSKYCVHSPFSGDRIQQSPPTNKYQSHGVL